MKKEKTKVASVKKLVSPSGEAGVFDTVVGTAVDGFVHYGLPWMGKKAVEMGRYGASELMRNKDLQKKAVNYGISKLTPFIQDSVGTAMDQLSTKVRPKKKYKTDRKDLDGGGIFEDMAKKLNDIVSDPQKFKEYQLDLANYAWQQAQIFGYRGSLQQFLAALGLCQIGSGITDKLTKSGVAGSRYHVDFKTGFKLLSDPDLWKTPTKQEKTDMKKRVAALKRSYDAVKRLGFKGSYTSFAKKLELLKNHPLPCQDLEAH